MARSFNCFNQFPLKKQALLSLLLCFFIVSCGGGGGASNSGTNPGSQNTSTATNTATSTATDTDNNTADSVVSVANFPVSEVSVPRLFYGNTPVSKLQNQLSGQVSAAAVNATDVFTDFSFKAESNATALIEFPAANETITSNFNIALTDITDPDGIERVALSFTNASSAIELCGPTSQACQTSPFSETVVGLNPRLLGQSAGDLTLEIWVQDTQSGVANPQWELATSRNFNWQPRSINNVTVETATGELQVSWDIDNQFSHYNIYAAADTTLTPENYATLDGGMRWIFVEGNSVTFNANDGSGANHLVDDEKSYSVVVTGIDGNGESGLSSVISVGGHAFTNNNLPVALNSELTLTEDSSISIDLSSLVSDVDVNNQLLVSIPEGSEPTIGSLSASQNGVVEYTPPQHFFGSDSFTYQVDDQHGGVVTATITLLVSSINDAPVVQIGNYQADTTEGLVTSIGVEQGLLTRVNDIDSDASQWTVVTTPLTEPQHGTVVLFADGSFTYTPSDSFAANKDTFEFQISDGDGGFAVGTVTLNAENPNAVNDIFVLDEDGVLNISNGAGFLQNDSAFSDVGLEQLQVSITRFPDNGVLSSVAGSGDAFIYTPSNSFFGVDSFTYQIVDPNGLTAEAVVSITVNAVNDQPIVANDSYQVAENGAITIAEAQGLLANDSDIDSANLSISSFTQPSEGVLTLNDDGSFTYQHSGGENEMDSFTYVITDGELSSATAQVQILIGAINDAPQFSSAIADLTINEDAGNQSISFSAADVDSVLSVSSFSIATELLTDGSLPISGLVISQDSDGSSSQNYTLSFTTEPNLSGQVRITLTVSDTLLSDAISFVVTVNAEDDLPSLTVDTNTIQIAEDAGQQTILFTANDVESLVTVSAQSSDVSIIETGNIVANPEVINGYILTYQTQPNANGSVQLALTATADQQQVVELITIDVQAVNDAPVISSSDVITIDEDAQQQSVSFTVSDIDNELTQSNLSVFSSEPTLIAVNQDNLSDVIDGVVNLTFTPIADQSGSSLITLILSDGLALEMSSFDVIVNAVNDAPVLAAISDVSVVEDTEQVNIELTASDIDSSLSSSSFSFSPAQSELYSSISFSGLTGEQFLAQITPISNKNGSETITISVQDGAGETVSQSFVLTISAQNDVPVAVADNYTLQEGETLTTTADNGILSNDTDIDGDVLTINLVKSTEHGELTVNQDGSFTYVHDGLEENVDSFTYSVSDQSSTSDVVTVSFAISNVNDTPIISGSSTTQTKTLQFYSFTPTAQDTDHSANELTFTVENAPSWTSFDNQTGQLSGTPAESDISLYQNIIITVTDAGGASASLPAFDLDVISSNEIPEISVIANQTINEDSDVVAINFTVSDPNTALSSLQLTAVSSNTTLIPNSGLSFSGIEANRTLSLQPTANENGTATLTITVSDGQLSASTAFEVVVAAVEDQPVVVNDSYSVAEAALLTVDIANGLLANDSDADNNNQATSDNDNLTASLDGEPQFGTLSLQTDGAFTYQHNGGEETQDSFTYLLNDGTSTVQGSVTITINPVNDAPVANEDSYSISEGGTLTVSVSNGVLLNDTDNDSSNLTASVNTQPQFGSLSFNNDGSFVYVHDDSENFNDTFTYLALDGVGGSTEGTVNIAISAVNEDPIISAIATQSGPEDTPISDINFTVSDPEQSSDTLSVSAISNNQTLIKNENIQIAGTGEARSITLTPEANTNGNATITVTVTDATNRLAATSFLVSINAQNDPPVAHPDTAETNNSTPVTVDVLANDTDADSTEGDTLTVTSASTTSTGAFVTIEADGSVTFTPAPNTTGTEVVTYVVSDSANATSSSTLTIQVSETAAMGSHDVNNDGVEDVEAGFNSDTNLWTVAFGAHLDAVFSATNTAARSNVVAARTTNTGGEAQVLAAATSDPVGRRFPVERDTDGKFRVTIADWEPNDQFQYYMVENGTRHSFVMAELDEPEPIAVVDTTGEELVEDFTDTANVPSELIEIFEGQAGYGPISAIKQQGTTFYLNTDNTAELSQYNNYQTGVWSVDSAGDITIVLDSVAESSNTYLVSELVNINALDAEEASVFIAQNGDIAVTAHFGVAQYHLAIVSNNDLFFEMNSSRVYQYRVPAVSDTTQLVTETAINSDWYNGDTLAVYELTSADVIGEWIMDIPRYNDGEFERYISEHLRFDEGGTGLFINQDQAFSWQLDNLGRIVITNDQNDTWTVSQIYQDSKFTTGRLLFNNGLGGTYTNINYIVPVSTPTKANIESTLFGKFMMSGYALTEPNYYVNGSFNAENTIAFAFSDAGLLLNVQGYSDSGLTQTLENNYQLEYDSAQNLVLTARVLTQNRGSYVQCSPSSLDICADYRLRNWQPVKLDTENNILWVLEWEDISETGTNIDSNSTTNFVELIAPRVNFYQAVTAPTEATLNFNLIPQASNSNLQVNEDEVSSVAILADVTASQDDQLTLFSLTASQGGVQISSDASFFNYTPISEFNGDVTLTYVMTDGIAYVPDTRTLTVNAVNDLPIANADIVVVLEDTTSELQVLDNDQDIDNNVLTITRVVTSNNAQASVTANNTISYLANANFNGQDSLTYFITDASGTEVQGEVSVTVNAVNDTPEIATISSQVIDEDSAVSLVVSATDIEDSSLNLVATSDNSSLLPDSNIALTQVNGIWTLSATPVADQNGSATISITAYDSLNGSTSTSFALQVSAINDAPSLSNIAAQTIDEDQTLSGLTLSVADLETASGNLTISLESDNQSLIPDDNLLYTGTGSEKALNIAPAANQSGTANITVTVSDGELSAVQNFALTVVAVNDAPVIEAISNQTISEDGSLTNLVITVSDVDTDLSQVNLTASSNLQTLVSDTDIAVVGQSTSRTLNLSAISDQNGVATISLVATDGVASSQQNFDLLVAAVNDGPSVDAIANQTFDEDGSTQIAIQIQDKDNDNLTVSASSNNSGLIDQSQLVLSGSGDTRLLDVSALANASGQATITVAVSDGAISSTTAFDVTVNAVNDAPEMSVIASQTTSEDVSLSGISLLVSDIDSDFNVLSIAASSDNNLLINNSDIVIAGTDGNKTISVTPQSHQFGSANIALTLSDGIASVEQSFIVIVNSVNDNAEISGTTQISLDEDNNALQTSSLTVSDVDENEAAFIASSVDGVYGAFNVTNSGVWTYALNTSLVQNLNVSDTVTDNFVVSSVDGTQAAVTVSITGSNDAPVITAISDITVDEDSGTQQIEVLISDVDDEVSNLSSALVSSNSALINANNLSLSGVGSSRILNFLSESDQNGSTDITLTLADNSNSSSDTFTVTVQSVADAAQFSGSKTASLTEDAAIQTASGVITIVDPDNGEANFIAQTAVQGSYGQFSLDAAGNWDYQLDAGLTDSLNVSDSVTDTFAITSADSTSDSVVISITGANDTPVIAAISNQSIDEDTSLSDLSFVVTDVDNDISATLVTATSSNTGLVLDTDISLANVNGARSISVSPVAHQYGDTQLQLTVSDGIATANQTFTLSVVSQPDSATVSGSQTASLIEDSKLLVTGTLTLLDQDNAEAQFTAVVEDANGKSNYGTYGRYTLTAGGTWQYELLNTQTNVQALAQDQQVSDDFVISSDDGTQFTVSVSITGSNDVPLVSTDNYALAEGDLLTISADSGVLINDSDIDSSNLTVTLNQATTYGVLSLNSDGSFSYQHDAGESTTDSFSYIVSDQLGQSDSVVVTLAISAVNDIPVAQPDSYSLSEGGTATVSAALGVLANDLDLDLDPLTVRLAATVKYGDLSLSSDGSFVYTHDGSETTADSFTYVVSDAQSVSAEQTVALTIAALNDKPVGLNDAYSLSENELLSVEAATGVLFNDTDAEKQVLTASLVTAPQYGDLSLNSDGSFTYQQNGAEQSTDTFVYQAYDNELYSELVTVTLSVTGVNDQPVAAAKAYTIAEGALLSVDTATGLISIAQDDDGDTLTTDLVNDTAYGVLTLNLDGSFTYQHDGSERLTDSFTYRVFDGVTYSASAAVDITMTQVNDAPIAAQPDYQIDEGDLLTVSKDSLVSLSQDDEGSALTAQLVTDAQYGQLTFNTDGTFTYQHFGNEYHYDSFEYRVFDGELHSEKALIDINLNKVNDKPVASNGTYSVNENAQITIAADSGLITLASDDEGDALTVIKDSDPSRGSLTINNDGSFVYSHNGGEETTDSFTYRVNDGLVDSDSAIITLNILGVNDAPVVSVAAATVLEGGLIGFTASELAVVDDDHAQTDLTITLDTLPKTGVLVNGTQPLTQASTFNASDIAAGKVSYTHNGDEVTSDSFTFTVSDSSGGSVAGEMSITVTPQNDSPVINNQSGSLNEGAALTFSSSELSASDEENTALTYTVTDLPSYGSLTLSGSAIVVNSTSFDESDISAGKLVYTHYGDEQFQDSFDIRVSDTEAATTDGTVSLSITPENDNPTITASSLTLAEGGTVTLSATELAAEDSDNAQANITFTLDSLPKSGILVNGTESLLRASAFTVSDITSGQIVYTHNGDEVTSDSFTFTVSDSSGGSVAGEMNITVTPQNDAPIIASVANQQTLEDTPITNLALLISDAETDVDKLIASATSDNQALIPDANVLLSLTQSASSVSIQPLSDQSGTANITVTVTDGSLTDQVSFAVTVDAANDQPVVSAIADISRAEDVRMISVDFSATDIDSALMLSSFSLASNDPTLVDGQSANFISLGNDQYQLQFQSEQNANGSALLTVTADDGSLSGSNSFTLTVTPVNDAPEITANPTGVDEGATINISTSILSALDVEDNQSGLQFTVTEIPSNGVLKLTGTDVALNDTFTYEDLSFSYLDYVHAGAENVLDSFTVSVADSQGLTATGTVSITVTPVNDAPVVTDASFSVFEAQSNASNVGLVSASDIDSNTLTFGILTGNDSGAFALNSATGMITIADSSALDFETQSSYTLTVQAEDDATPALSDTATISISVTDLQEAQTFDLDSNFNSDGIAEIDLMQQKVAANEKVEFADVNNGKPYVVGTINVDVGQSQDDRYFVAQFNADGTLDKNFGDNFGVWRDRASSPLFSEINQVLVDDQNRYWLIGTKASGSNANSGFIKRLSTSGLTESSFSVLADSAGVTQSRFVQAVFVGASNLAIVEENVDTGSLQLKLYDTSDDSWVTSFASTGSVALGSTSSNEVTALLGTAANDIVVVSFANSSEIKLNRYDINGALYDDSASYEFGSQGEVFIAADGPAVKANDVVELSDGSLFLAGVSTDIGVQTATVWALTKQGDFVTGYSHEGKAVPNNTALLSELYHIDYFSDNEILVSGYGFDANSENLLVSLIGSDAVSKPALGTQLIDIVTSSSSDIAYAASWDSSISTATLVGTMESSGSRDLIVAQAKSTGILTSFGEQGYTTANLHGRDEWIVKALPSFDNGTYMVSGQIGNGSQVVVSKLTADGYLDTSFAKQGHYLIDLLDENEATAAMTYTKSGTEYLIVAVSSSSGSSVNSMQLIKLDQNGEHITAFDGQHSATDISGQWLSLKYNTNTEQIIAAGELTESSSNFAIAKYSATTGVLDLTLDQTSTLDSGSADGILEWRESSSLSNKLYGAWLDDDGSVKVAGYVTTEGPKYLYLADLSAAGELVVGGDFGSTGFVVSLLTSGGNHVVKAIEQDSKGRFIVAGHATFSGSGKAFVVRLGFNAVLDNDFGTSGMATYQVSQQVTQTQFADFETFASDLLIDELDRPLISGYYFNSLELNNNLFVTRILSEDLTISGSSAGSVDPSFYGNSFYDYIVVDLTNDDGQNELREGWALQLDPDGSIKGFVDSVSEQHYGNNLFVIKFIASDYFEPLVLDDTPQSYTIIEDEIKTFTIDVYNASGTDLTVYDSNISSLGNISNTPVVNGNQITVTYVPFINASYNENITLFIQDDNGFSDTIDVSFTVTAVNDIPEVYDYDNGYTLIENTYDLTVYSDETDPSATVLIRLEALDFDQDLISWSLETAAADGEATVTEFEGGRAPEGGCCGEGECCGEVGEGGEGLPTIIIGGKVTAAAVTQPIQPSSSLGVVTYRPDEAFVGTDSFVVRVSDGNGGNNDITFNVTVEDFNNAPVMQDQSFDIIETASANQILGTLAYSDEDDSSHTFSINSDSSGGLFDLNTSTGQLSLAASADLDYESSASYTLSITVTDQGGASGVENDGTSSVIKSDTATVTINVEDVLKRVSATLDTSYGDQGVVKHDLMSTEQGQGVSVKGHTIVQLVDNSLVRVAQTNSNAGLIVKTLADGTPDLSFGRFGKLELGGSSSDFASLSGRTIRLNSIVADSTHIYVAGDIDGTNGLDVFVAKLDFDGNLDTNFDTPLGFTTFDSGGSNQTALDVDLYNGALYLVGYAGSWNETLELGVSNHLVISMDATTGALNTSFNATGYMTYLYDEGGFSEAVAVHVVRSGVNEGDIVIGGWNYETGKASLAMFDSAGSPVSSFDATGIKLLNSMEVRDMSVVDTNSRIFLAGHDGNNGVVSAYDFTGTALATFGTSGVVSISPTTVTPNIAALNATRIYFNSIVHSADALIVGGSFETLVSGETQQAVIKLSATTGAIDNTFAGNLGYIGENLAAGTTNPIGRIATVIEDSQNNFIAAGWLNHAPNSETRSDLTWLNFDANGNFNSTSFTGGGKLVDNYNNSNESYYSSIAYNPTTNSLYVMGYSYLDSNEWTDIVKLTGSGLLDFEFGSAGNLVEQSNVNQLDRTSLILSDGTLLSFGVNYESGDQLYIRAFNADGTIKQGFGSSGSYYFSGTAGYDIDFTENFTLVGKENDLGQIEHIFATAHNGSGTTDIFALDVDGNAFNVFDGSDSTTLLLGSTNVKVKASIIDEAGHLVLAGMTNESDNQGFIARIDLVTNLGDLDTGFDSNGYRLFDLQADNRYDDITDLEMFNGGYLAIGNTFDQDGVFWTMAVDSSGNPQTGFGTNGNKTTTTGLMADTQSYQATVDLDNSVYVAASYTGGTDTEARVFRFDGKGELDTGFNGTGFIGLSLTDTPFVPQDIILDNSGKLLLVSDIGVETTVHHITRYQVNAEIAPAILEGGQADRETFVRDSDTGFSVTLNAVDPDTDSTNLSWSILSGNASLDTTSGNSVQLTLNDSYSPAAEHTVTIQVSDGSLTDSYDLVVQDVINSNLK